MIQSDPAEADWPERGAYLRVKIEVDIDDNSRKENNIEDGFGFDECYFDRVGDSAEKKFERVMRELDPEAFELDQKMMKLRQKRYSGSEFEQYRTERELHRVRQEWELLMLRESDRNHDRWDW